MECTNVAHPFSSHYDLSKGCCGLALQWIKVVRNSLGWCQRGPLPLPYLSVIVDAPSEKFRL